MNINNLNFRNGLYDQTLDKTLSSPLNSPTVKTSENSSTDTSFSKLLTHSLNSLENKQIQSDQAAQDLVTGEADNLHNVMIKATEAQLSLELAVQIRNRCLEAINEVKNMQF